MKEKVKNCDKFSKSRPIFIGIDEAGRGPLAGPVSVGAFAVRSRSVLRKFKGVKESKQLSEAQREVWFKEIKRLHRSGEIAFAVSFSSEKVIDDRGITYAVYSAIRRSLKKLTKRNFCTDDSVILLDGLLHAPKAFKNQKTIIGGDESEPLIALASICAKVLRDHKMCRIAKLYPEYGFELHKGYGTKMHLGSIKKNGILAIHRRSYLKGVTGPF
ncbi:MAG: ribonuclease HII [Candidatus Paceibacterota bacterium]|jgi:ribonuclease HII